MANATSEGSDAGGGEASSGSDTGSAPPDTGTAPPQDSGGGMVESGAPETGPAMEAGGGVTFTQVYTTILSMHCLPCHATGGGKTNGKLDMSTQANAYTNLVGAAAAGTMCTGKGTRVVKGDSTNSLLVQKLKAAPPCGKQMPSGMAPLGAPLVTQISQWIDSGAANN
jgi:hypothetical protein